MELAALAFLIGAGTLAFWASRELARAERLVSLAPLELDAAIDAARGGRPVGGVFQGRLDAIDPVTSPAGVVCAFYQAEIRAPGAGAKQGALLSVEHAQAQVVYLRGGRSRAAVPVVGDCPLAPAKACLCQLGSRLAFALPRCLAEGEPPRQAISLERVGKIGAPCLVLGRLCPGPAPGSWRLAGGLAGPPLLVVGEDPLAAARQLGKRCWVRFSFALVLCMLSACLLAQA